MTYDVLNTNTTLREALTTTCKLHNANNILAKIAFTDQTAEAALSAMSAKSVEDACDWTTATLEALGSLAQCRSDNSSLTWLCDQWNDVVSIKKVESKVDDLNTALSRQVNANETQWINRQQFDDNIADRLQEILMSL